MNDVNTVICYDGSAASRASISRVAHLMPNGLVTILTAWQPMEAFVLNWMVTFGSTESMNADIKRAAHVRAMDGVQRARDAGLVATEATVEAGSAVGPALLEFCAREAADLIVVGASGHSAVTHLLTGSVASHVLHHASAPVLVVHAGGMDETAATSPPLIEHAAT